MPQHTNLAVIFDFDDTLVPDSTSLFLEDHGIDVDAFWQSEKSNLVEQGYDPTNAWLNAFLEKAQPDDDIGQLTNEDLRSFGSTLDAHTFDGVPEIFSDLENIVSNHRDVSIEYYIISGGLRELILGTELSDYLEEIYACELGSQGGGYLNRIKKSVNFTEKTKYLFEINKGITREESQSNPYIVNRQVDYEDRRVRWENMIYVGDGLTDVPCFSLLKRNGGYVYGVFDQDNESSKQRAIEFMEAPWRVDSPYLPNYTENSSLGNILRAKIQGLCVDATTSQAI